MLRVRDTIAGLDPVELVCWIGARLAEALAHAHALGVLHRDVKPANVLVNPYGRPLLADFNIACYARGRTERGEGPSLGGTLAYMPPEILDAFASGPGTPPGAIDGRCDIYSLGVVLWELLTGQLPFPLSETRGAPAQVFHDLAEGRRAGPPALPAGVLVTPTLERVLRRSLAPVPEERFHTSSDLAAALDACREMRRIEKELPKGGSLTQLAVRHPFITGAVLTILPQVVGSIVNISYNALRVVPGLNEEGRVLFPLVVLAYNAVAYPLCLGILFRQVAPVFRACRQAGASTCSAQVDLDASRQHMLRLPRWAIVVTCLGWLPGGVLFPLTLHALTGPPDRPVLLSFIVSFTVSGLIALTYTVFAVQFIVLRVLYPRLWGDAHDLKGQAARELSGIEARLGLLQFFAVLIPLTGAVLMLSVGPEQLKPAAYRNFRILVTALLDLGTSGRRALEGKFGGKLRFYG